MSEPVSEYYLGINRKIKPPQLPAYEETGGFVIEEKYDGWWCSLEIGGAYVYATTRYSNSITDFPDIETKFNTTVHLIGEWMPKDGCMWIHDVIRTGTRDLRGYPVHARRVILEDIYTDIISTDKLRLVPQFTCGFKDVYEDIVADGGEGVVLKHRESLYYARNSLRKSGLWIKCKPEYEDKNENKNNMFISTSGSGYLSVS